MARYALFDPATGEIEAVIDVANAQSLHENLHGRGHVEAAPGVDDTTHYVFGGALVERPAVFEGGGVTIAANGADEFRLLVPNGTRAGLEGSPLEEVADGEVVFTASVPGEYRLRLWPPFPQRVQEIMIHAV